MIKLSQRSASGFEHEQNMFKSEIFTSHRIRTNLKGLFKVNNKNKPEFCTFVTLFQLEPAVIPNVAGTLMDLIYRFFPSFFNVYKNYISIVQVSYMLYTTNSIKYI